MLVDVFINSASYLRQVDRQKVERKVQYDSQSQIRKEHMELFRGR